MNYVAVNGTAARPGQAAAAGRSGPSFLSISHLNKEFVSQDGNSVVALSDVSLDMAAGEFVTVVGPSGCGKSTMLHILAGVTAPSNGRVVMDGRPVDGPRRDVGVVFQEALLLPWRTVLDNVLLPIEVLRLPVVRYRDRAHELIELTNLAGFEHKYPHELSGGMQQRVSIARALIHDPAILLMDEPFGALDAMTREQMNLDLLKIWSAAKKTVLLITHSVPEAILLGDRVVAMSPRPGHIVDVIDIDLPRPRTIDMSTTPAFGIYAKRIRDHLFGRAAADRRNTL
jgi:NitT/TauT family transport system ATP-binding protein